MQPQDLAGSSYRWWPPRHDHVMLYKLNPVRFGFFDRYVPTWHGVRVLDVGCGGGYTCEYLARRGAEVHGTDLFEPSLEEARRHAAETGLHIDYRQGTRERLPFEGETADVVTCFDVLEHVPDKDKAHLMSEIRRVLKPGGWLFLDTFTRSLWSRLFIIWLGEVVFRAIPRGTHDWRLFLKPSDLQHLLTTSDFGTGEVAGIRPSRRQAPDGLPLKVCAEGRKSIMYFAAVRRPMPPGFQAKIGQSD